MPRQKLTDAGISRLKPDWLMRPAKYYDSATRGLYVLASPNGRKVFRFRYQIGKKEHVLTLGRYEPGSADHMTLADARAAAAKLTADIQKGAHPARDKKQADDASNGGSVTFKAAAEDYLERASVNRASTTVGRDRLMHKYCGSIDSHKIAELKPVDLRRILDKLEDRPESQRKMRHFLTRVFAHAVAMDWRERNPMLDLGKLNYGKKDQRVNRPAITDPNRFGELLRAIDGYTGSPPVVEALRMLPHVFLRPGELRCGRWGEVDLKENLWTIPAERMKMRREHVVPISKQVREMFLNMQVFSDTDPDSLLFPSLIATDKPISDNTINSALRRLGFDTKTEHCAHGFRATASTLMYEHEKGGDVIEAALSHVGNDVIRKTYDRSTLLEQRRELMQWWSDYLDKLKITK